MKLGDSIKRLLAPFVKGTKYQDCKPCQERANALNNWWTMIQNFFKGKF